MKRLLVSLILFAFLFSIFTGCGQSSGQSTTNNSNSESKPAATEEKIEEKKPAEAITLNFLWQGLEDSALETWHKYFLDPFEAKYNNVTINFQTVPNIGDTVKVQVAAGKGPDIFMMDAFDIKDFAETDRILDLDKYSAQYGWKDIMYDWAYNSCVYNGKLYAVPYGSECTLLWYNKTLLDQNGWKVPETRAEFEEICQAAAGKGIIPIGYGFSGAQLMNQWLYDHYVSAYAGNENVAALLKGQKKFADPEIKGAFEILKADWDKGWWHEKKSGAINFDEGRAAFTSGKALFNAEGSWFFGEIGDIPDVNFEYGATTWPSMKDGIAPSTSYASGEVININKSTKHPDECAALLNFLYTDVENAAKGIAQGMETLCRDIDPSLYPSDIKPSVKKGLELQAKLMKECKNISYCPWGFYPAKTNQYLYENLEKVFYDTLSVDEYLNKAQEIFDQEKAKGFVFIGK